jgi:hypothetical protein
MEPDKMIRKALQQTIWVAFAALALAGAGCARPAPAPAAQCLAIFPSHPDWPDTLHCFLADSSAGLPVSDTLLKTVLDSAQFASLHFGTGEARFWALGQFPFADGLSAAMLQTEEFWFGKLSLLVFVPGQQRCLAVVELSHFYGGDGGQTASEAWLFRRTSPPRLFVKNAEHGFVLPDDETDDPREYLREYGRLFQWEINQFRPVDNPDSLLFLQRYPMHRTW